ncbi:MAG: hypothetical protein QME90_13905 [Thermodesulfobacteriota bacterium]|nr:hypothetical protein [Thermodesulfobacteriota bacterium]
MARNAFLTVLFVSLVIPALAWAHAGNGDVVDVRILSDSGEVFPKYRTYLRRPQEGKFFYMEAVKGQRYSIQVTNKSDRRIGVVIAVDGRNIIDGKKSDLNRKERMYIVGPHESNTFEGWRTGMDRTNRFFFTEQSDSYAEKVFADASAMGTIALAVYREKLPEIVPYSGGTSRMKDAPAGAAPCVPGESLSADRSEQKKNVQAGTGFGETTYSPAYMVRFDPEYTIAEKIVLKYEWRSELCRKGIIPCGPKNRFWPDDYEFAPIPRDFRG